MGPSKKKIDALDQRMKELNIREVDIEEHFIKASGRGGQKVNKTSSAVFLKHLPTGLTVKCGAERSQNLNRFLALRRLVDKIQALQTGGRTQKEEALERIRKQKQRRKRKSKKKHNPDGLEKIE